MKSTSNVESSNGGESLINNPFNISAYLQQPEFQRLRSEFERILDDYLLKSTQAREDEMPSLIHDTTKHINTILKKAATFTRNLQDVNDIDDN